MIDDIKDLIAVIAVLIFLGFVIYIGGDNAAAKIAKLMT